MPDSGQEGIESDDGREQFLQLPMSEVMARQREEWLSLVEEFNQRIKSLDTWLERKAPCRTSSLLGRPSFFGGREWL